MEKILIWYVDSEGDTRLQEVEKLSDQTVEELLAWWWDMVGNSYTLLEAFTLTSTHEVLGSNSGNMKVTTTNHTKGEQNVL